MGIRIRRNNKTPTEAQRIDREKDIILGTAETAPYYAYQKRQFQAL